MCESAVYVILSVRLPVSNRLSVVKFWGYQKLHKDFQLLEGLLPLTPVFSGSPTVP